MERLWSGVFLHLYAFVKIVFIFFPNVEQNAFLCFLTSYVLMSYGSVRSVVKISEQALVINVRLELSLSRQSSLLYSYIL